MKKSLDFFQDQISQLAKKDKVSYDFYAYGKKDNKVCFENKKLKNYSSSEDRNLALRLSNDQTSGVSYTTDFSQKGLEACYKQALQSLKISDRKERGELSVNQNYLDMTKDIYKKSNLDLSEKIDRVKCMDQAALSLSDKIQPLYNASVDQDVSCVFGNSMGTQGSYYTNSIHAFSYSLAVDKNKRSEGISEESLRDYKKIDFEKLGQESASKSLKKLDFLIPKTATYPVIFQSGQTVSTLLSLLLDHLNGKTIYESLSLLKGTLNEKKFSDQFFLYDDPLVPWGLRSAPFDEEGFSSQKTTLIDQGVVKNYLTNSFFAKILQAPHTAKASRSSNGIVQIAPSNIIMQEGKNSFEDLLKEHAQVVIIDRLKGLAGYNAISGDFSIESEGFLHNENGSQAICQFTISGNLISVFANISKIANDSKIYEGSFQAPSFLVSALSIAGK